MPATLHAQLSRTTASRHEHLQRLSSFLKIHANDIDRCQIVANRIVRHGIHREHCAFLAFAEHIAAAGQYVSSEIHEFGQPNEFQFILQ